MGNGSVERFNQTLIKMLTTLDEGKKNDWKSYIAPLVQAYNATKNGSTAYSPHYLMFDWQLPLLVDAVLGVDQSSYGGTDRGSYLEKLRKRLAFANKTAAQGAKKKMLIKTN